MRYCSYTKGATKCATLHTLRVQLNALLFIHGVSATQGATVCATLHTLRVQPNALLFIH